MPLHTPLHRPLFGPLFRALTDAGSSSAAWTPARLFAASEQGGWYDPSDLSSMFQDSAGTTPAVVDSVVGKINDKSGRGNHMVQATTAAKPILRLASGRYYLEFDSVDDVLSVTLGAAADYVRHAMGYAGKYRSVAVDALAAVSMGRSSSATPFSQTRTNAGSIEQSYRNDAATAVQAIGSASDTSLNTIINNSAAANFNLRKNATITARAAASGATTMDRLGMGALTRSAIGAFAPVDVYGAVYLGRALTTTEEAMLATYLGAKVGAIL